MKLFANDRNPNLLEGPIIGKIFAFVIPLMITNLLQTLYSSADMIVVGLSNVEGAIGAIGTTGAMLNLILNIFMGFAAGTGVVVARRIGEASQEKTEKAVHTAVLTSLISGLACLVIGLVFGRPMLILLGDEGHVLELATLYTNIYMLGVPFISLNNFFMAILRAKGDTGTSLKVLSISGIINVVLNLFFVLVCGMSVEGVAIATVVSTVFSTVVLGRVLIKDTGWCQLSIRKLHIDRISLKDIIINGIPAGLQGALFSISNMAIQSSVNQVNNALYPGGSVVIDGNAAASNLEGFAYNATNSVCQASITFTSQHYGARKFRRMKRVIADCYLVTFATSIIVAMSIVAFRYPLLGLYVSDSAAVEVGSSRMLIMLVPYFSLAFMEVGSGVLRGLNKSILSTTISLIGSVVLRLVWLAVIFEKLQTLQSIYISYPISWMLTALMHFIFWSSVYRRDVRTMGSVD